MKRFSPREILFLCAPVAVIVAVLVGLQLRNPPRDPNSVIALSVTSVANPPTTLKKTTFNFEWNAKAQGGPRNEIELLYAQQFVALNADGSRSQIIFQKPNSRTAPNIQIIHAGQSDKSGPALEEQSQNIGIPYENLPIWAKRVEWRGDFVALPLQSGQKNASGVGIPATFSTLARIKGAARVTKTFPVSFDAKRIRPFQQLKLVPVTLQQAIEGADTGVATELRNSPRKIHARLIAFDGTKTRQLWSNSNPADNAWPNSKYWVTRSFDFSSNFFQSNSQLFKLRDVPAQWGELIYVADAVFDPDPSKATMARGAYNYNTAAPADEIEHLKKAGWEYDSKRLIVRKAGATIVAPTYPKTPNSQYVGTRTSISKAGWAITVRWKHRQPKAGVGSGSGSRMSFVGADGKPTFVGAAQIAFPSSKNSNPNEPSETIIIPLNKLGQPRPVTLKIEIGDGLAAPLRVETKLMVPKAPA